MERNKSFLWAVILILAGTLILGAIPTEKEASIYEDTVRLHILANSDADEDQNVKIKIRDRLLEKYSKELSSFSSAADAKKEAAKLIPDIEADVNGWLWERGFSYGAEIFLCEEWYDTRDYGNISLPRGNYTSLQIHLGNAEGKNWWCVMYPPLCLDVATESLPEEEPKLTEEQTKLVSNNGYCIKFKLLEIISEVFH